MEKLTLNQLRDACYSTAYKKGWHDKPRTLGDFLMLMVSELAEALEEYRNGKDIDEVYLVDGKPEGVPVEIADVLIRIFDFCGYHDIDIEQVTLDKMEYNGMRPYRHGGKAL